MGARKKHIFKVKKNRFGRPLISARSDISKFVYDGKEYNEIHVYASLSDIQFTLRSTDKNFFARPKAVSGIIVFSPYDHYDQYTLVEKVKCVIKDFSDGTIPEGKELHTDSFGVLI